MKTIDRDLKNLIFRIIQVLANLDFQCAKFKWQNIKLGSFYEKKLCLTKQL